MKHRIRAASIIVNDNKILLVKHVHPLTKKEWWVPPGGGMEKLDRSIFDCAKRETFEETNLEINNSRLIYVREFYSKEDQTFNVELFVFVDSFNGEISLKNIKGKGIDEQFIKEVSWLPKEKLNDIVVFPEMLRDEFWDDYAKNFPNIKYLGRQVG